MARLLVLFVTAFVDMVGLTMILPLLPFYATELGASATVVGLLVSAFSVAQLVVAPVWGRFSDRYGRRPAILAGLLLTSCAYVIFAFAGSVPLLLLCRLVQGLGGGTIGVVQAYVADASSAEERTKSLGWLSAVTSLGAVAGPAFGSAMITLGGRAAPGLGAAALALLVAAFAARYLVESRQLPSGSHAATSSTRPRQAIGRVLSHWHEPASRLIWVYTIGIGAFYGTIQVVPLLLMSRLGITERNIGYFIMYLGGMGVVVRSLLLGRAVDFLGEARLSRLGLVLLAAGLGCTGLASHGALLFLGFTLMPLGTAFLFPCVTGLLSRAVPANERGLYMGVQHTFGGVSRVLFPIAAGLLIDRFGVGVPFWLAGLLVLATLPFAWALADSLSPESPATVAVRSVASTDVTGEFPVQKVAE
ncbi:MAG TPA: MFS transporter [Gemmatimonadales bacterium]|jgi:MFS family permease|nr:MFS transporter [Gemmatimonadales bacterium]